MNMREISICLNILNTTKNYQRICGVHVLLHRTVICGKCQKLMDALFVHLYAQKLMQVNKMDNQLILVVV